MENRKILYSKLDKFIRKYYLNQLIRGGILTLLSLLVLFIFISILEHYMNFDVMFRTFLFWTYIVINSIIISKFILAPILQLLKISKGLKHKDAAKIIGNHFKEIDDKLLNVLELVEMNENNDLINASIDQKTASISPVPVLNAINFKSNIKKGNWLLIPFILLFVLFISGKKHVITDSSERIIKHNTFFEPEAPYNIIFEQELLAEQYNDYLLKIKIEGNEIPNNFLIEYENNRFLMHNKNKNTHQYLFKNIQKNKIFRINGGGYKSKNYKIKVIPKPIIKDVTTIIIPPKYTRLENEKYNSLEDIAVAEGSLVKWIIEYENVDSVLFEINKKTYKEKVRGIFEHSSEIRTIKKINVSYKNIYDIGDTINFKVDLIKDNFPAININPLIDSINNVVTFDGILNDDYGISKLTFNYDIISNNEVKKHFENIKIKKEIEETFFYEYDFNSLDLNEGDKVNYYFEVWDNDLINGNKKTKSQDFVFKKKTKEELIVEKDEINKELKSSLDKSANKASDLRNEIEKFNKQMLNKKMLSWQEKEKAKEILNKQKEILREIEENKKLNEIQNKKQSELNPSILEKHNQLKELMENVIDEEIKQLLEEFEQLLDEDDKEKLKELLDKLDTENEDLEKELDRELELFKQLEFEQKTEEIVEKINKIKEEQKSLKEETDSKKLNNNELSKKQDELEKEMDSLKESINKLKEKNNKLENKNKIPETEETQEKISELMKESKEDLNKNQNKKSSKKQQESIEQLEKLENMLNSMLESNSEEMQIENIETLREILDNLIILSFSQEKLIEKTQKTKVTSSEFIALVRQQQKLVLDSKIIEDSLFALSKRVVKIQSKINSEITLIKDNMNESKNFLEERRVKKSAEKQQFVMTSANNLALLLSEILKSMQMDLSMMPSSCKKPKNCNNPKNSNNPSMSEIKKAQKQLNKNMKNGKQNGQKNKGKNKMSNKDLMQLARKQGLIKSELEKLENNKQGSKGSKLIDEMKKQMEENEYDIINNNISNMTFERLDQLIENFIDYEKAKKEEGEEEKRESNEWLINDSRQNSDYNKMLKEKKKQLELININPLNLKPYYKKEVRKYFNSISKEK